MIDRPARDNLAERLRHLAAGTMTNDAFEDSGAKSMDEVIREIEFRLAWPCYDDLHEHTLSGDYAITRGKRLDFARAVLFLKTDLPYEWKRQTGIGGFLSSLFRLFPPDRRARLLTGNGDLRVWPFFRYSDYRQALGEQPYLRGQEIKA
jgi:hypothetical protein